MRGKVAWIFAAAMSLLLLAGVIPITQAQGGGILVIIQGQPDATSSPPLVRTYVSVVDPSSGGSIEGLGPGQFEVVEAGKPVANVQVGYDTVGLALVLVVDRGGISAPGANERAKQAADLVRELAARLNVPGSPADDIVALVGISRENNQGVIKPEADFTYNPVDVNYVLNALVDIEGETVSGGTPLYEGLDRALTLLTNHPNPTIRELLTHRRKVVIAFSDGIDKEFSNAAKEQDIINKAQAADISIYTFGMAKGKGTLSAEAEGNLIHLASQTSGRYLLHNQDTHVQVLALFDQIMTQRRQYLVTYETRLRKGTYELAIEANTPQGTSQDAASFSSVLEPIRLELTNPPSGALFEVPYSTTLGLYEPRQIVLTAQVTAVDGAPRDPAEVRYLANGQHIGTGYPPDYAFSWELSTMVTATGEVQAADYTFKAETDDPWLGDLVQSTVPVQARVTWGAYPFWPEGAKRWLFGNWGFLAGFGVLLIGLIFLVVMLIRTRGELAKRVVQRATGVMKGLTRRLTPEAAHPWGKMIVLQGNSPAREFPLIGNMLRFGRNPQFCDCPLYDDYVSNPHFTVFLEGTEVYIQDEGSTNKTRVNGLELSPHVRQPLPADAFVDAGMTRLQFKRSGLTTQTLDVGTPPRT